MTRDHVSEWPLWLALALGLVLAFGCAAPRPARMAIAAPDLGVHGRSLGLAAAVFPCDLFAVARPGQEPAVVIRDIHSAGSVCSSGKEPRSGQAYQCSSGRWEIWADWSRLSTTESYLLFAHELGHAAGLSDAPAVPPGPMPWVVSIMAANAMAHAGRVETGLLLPVLLRRDRAEIERRWCR